MSFKGAWGMTASSITKGWGIAKQLLPVVLIVFAFNAVTAVGMLSVIGVNPTAEKITQITGVLMILFFILMLLWILLEGGLFSAVHSYIKTGTSELSTFLNNCFKFFTRLLGINIIGGLLTIIIWFVGAFICGIFIALGKGENIFFNIIAIIMLVITAIAAFIITIPILIGQYLVVVDNGGAINSLKKAIGCVKKSLGSIVMLFLLLGIIFTLFSYLANFIGALIGNAIGGWPLALINIFLNASVNSFISVFASGCILTLLLTLIVQSTQEQTRTEVAD